VSSSLEEISERLKNIPPEERVLSAEEWRLLFSRLERIALLRSIQAKYAHLTTSSEAFAARKAEEIALEDRRR
jgi:hypothetical protein